MFSRIFYGSIFSASLLFINSTPVSATGSGTNAKNVQYGIMASCGTRTVALKYKFDDDNELGKRLLFSEAELSNASKKSSKVIAIGEMPLEIQKINRPFVVKVVPICIEQGDILFIFYISSEGDLGTGQESNGSHIQQLHLEFSKEAKVKKYVIQN